MAEEARTGKRFPLELPIKIHKGETGADADGVTGNLGAAGVYIRAVLYSPEMGPLIYTSSLINSHLSLIYPALVLHSGSCIWLEWGSSTCQSRSPARSAATTLVTLCIRARLQPCR